MNVFFPFIIKYKNKNFVKVLFLAYNKQVTSIYKYIYIEKSIIHRLENYSRQSWTRQQHRRH